MPSFIIHLAIAKRYAELHPKEISDFDDFQKGSIAPDLSQDYLKVLSKPEKIATHYYDQPESGTNFDLFRKDEKIDPTNDYWKGYYLHLLADQLFYFTFFPQEVERSFGDGANLYDDFTILTSKIIEDYNPVIDADYITDAVKQFFILKDGDCKYLDYEKVHDFIEKVASDPSNIIY